MIRKRNCYGSCLQLKLMLFTVNFNWISVFNQLLAHNQQHFATCAYACCKDVFHFVFSVEIFINRRRENASRASYMHNCGWIVWLSSSWTRWQLYVPISICKETSQATLCGHTAASLPHCINTGEWLFNIKKYNCNNGSSSSVNRQIFILSII